MALAGNEILLVQGIAENGQPSGEQFATTTQAVANLGSGGGGADTPLANTAITTVGAGTLTAAALAGGVITRTGPVAAYTDTTATAALIVAAIPNAFVGQSWVLRIKNGTNFTQTLAAGSGVTFSGSVVVPPSSVAEYLVTLTSLSAVSMLHLSTTLLTNNTPESITVLSTVGAGTITAAGIVGGVTSRTGSQSGSAFTDTTATADLVIAAQANAHVGVSWEYVYNNTTNAPATLAGGSGVTVSGITVVPARTWARFLVTYTVASTVTIVGIESGITTTGTGTFVNNGTSTVTTSDANVTAFSNIIITLKTVGGTVGAIPHLLTITPGTGFATVGTASDTSTYNYLIIG